MLKNSWSDIYVSITPLNMILFSYLFLFIKMRFIDVCAGLYVIISLVTKSLYPLERLCND